MIVFHISVTLEHIICFTYFAPYKIRKKFSRECRRPQRYCVATQFSKGWLLNTGFKSFIPLQYKLGSTFEVQTENKFICRYDIYKLGVNI